MSFNAKDLSEAIEDPRQQTKVIHPLENILLITICATIAGADTWKDIAEFGRVKKDFFRKFLALPDNNSPSEDTIARLFSVIKAKDFANFFNNWITLFIENGVAVKHVAIDGKVLRRSHDKGKDKSAIHMVSAWSNEHNCVLAQVKVDEKSNEITAIPKLLKILDLEGTIVTIDAMGTQKAITTNIANAKGDYILPVKSNQPTLETDIMNYFGDKLYLNSTHEDIKYIKTEEHSHGVSAVREFWISSDTSYITNSDDWTKLNSIGMTRSTRTIDGKTTRQEKFYILSIKDDIEAFAKYAREHWGIENKLHWCLDIGFREDDCRIRAGLASENMASIRHIVISMLKNEKSYKGGIISKRNKAGWDEKYMRKVIGI